jgi:hypothetical protein
MWFIDRFRRGSKTTEVAEPRHQAGGIVPICGEVAEHGFWLQDGWPCPLCASIRRRQQAPERRPDATLSPREQKDRYHEDLARAVADQIVERLRKEGML